MPACQRRVVTTGEGLRLSAPLQIETYSLGLVNWHTGNFLVGPQTSGADTVGFFPCFLKDWQNLERAAQNCPGLFGPALKTYIFSLFFDVFRSFDTLPDFPEPFPLLALLQYLNPPVRLPCLSSRCEIQALLYLAPV